MNYIHHCPKCGEKMKRIPIRRKDGTIVVEYYCDKCDESATFYPEEDIFRREKAHFY